MEFYEDKNFWRTTAKAIDFFKPDINYGYLKDVANYKELQAEALEAQVQEQVNLIRQQFIENIGAYEAQAAQRGVKVGEGSARLNVEKSAMELGKDVQTADKNMKYKQGQLRRSAKQYRSSAESTNILGFTEKFVKNFGIQEK